MAPQADSVVWLDGSGPPRPRRGPAVPHSVLGMLLVVVMELMMFAGLVSAYLVAQAANPGSWPPPGQPRLPIEATAFNTLVLLASGALVWVAGRSFASAETLGASGTVGAAERAKADRLLLIGTLLGSFFVLFQGFEWVRLINEGLTLNYSTHGSFFYLIVGTHALHAIVALGALSWAYGKLRGGLLTDGAFWTVRILWFFVVGLWPALYALVYLS